MRAITLEYQHQLRTKRQATNQQNTYQPGDLILWNPKEHTKSFRTSKLTPKLLGPYTVKKQNGNNVTCQHTKLESQHVFHADRIMPYIGTEQSAKHIGLLDQEEFIVESIVNHRGNWSNLKSIELLVRWQGYTSEADSWEPWSSLRRVAALHDYLHRINQTKYIPHQFRAQFQTKKKQQQQVKVIPEQSNNLRKNTSHSGV